MKKLFLLFLAVVLVLFAVVVAFPNLLIGSNKSDEYFLFDESGVIELYSDSSLFNHVENGSRGIKVEVDEAYKNELSARIFIDGSAYFVQRGNLVQGRDKLTVFDNPVVKAKTTLYETYGFIGNSPLGFVNQGENVEILEVKYVENIEWVKVSFSDQEGYVLGKYITTEELEDDAFMTNYISSNNLGGIDLSSRVSTITQYNNQEQSSVYLDYNGFLDENLLTKSEYFQHMSTIYVEYFDGEKIVSPITKLSNSQISQTYITDKEKVLEIVSDLNDLDKKVIVEISLMNNYFLNQETGLIDLDDYQHWKFYTELIDDLYELGIDEIVFSNLGFETETFDISNAEKLQMLYIYLYDYASQYDMIISGKVSQFNALSDKVNSDNTQINVISNVFDRVYVETIFNDMPSGYLDYIYPWNVPEEVIADIAWEYQNINKYSNSDSIAVLLTQAYSTPTDIYPPRHFNVDIVTQIVRNGETNGFDGGHVLINTADDLSSYDFLLVLLND